MTSVQCKTPMPLHVACATGKKNAVKKIVDSVPVRVLEIKDEFGRTALIICIIHNEIDCASLLLKAGVHVNNSDFSGQTALHIAVHNGFHRCVKLLLQYNANYLQKDISGVTPLHLAAIHSNTKCLNLMLKDTKPGEVDIQDTSKKTALHWSTAYSNFESTKVLLMKGCNICIPDVEGKTPLHWAATCAKPQALECAKILLEKEGNLINWQDYEGRTALHLAVVTGSAEVVRFLVCRDGCDVDVPDNSFCTPLHWAAKRGLHDKVDILLNGGACYSSVDGKQASPLHYAAYKNCAKTVSIFLSRSYVTEKDVKDEDGRNALMWAAAQNADDVVSVMAENGLDLLDGDPNKITALHAAAIQGHVSTVELLLELKVPVDLNDKYGMTPLLRACEYGRSKIAQVLINHGANIHISDVNKRTALHWCALGGHAYLCQVLLHKGALCSIQDTFGMTPLHYACMKNGYLNCVSVLLESEANPNIIDIKGLTPLHWAVMSKHQGVVRLLCEYDANVNAMALKDSWITPLDLAVNKGGSSLEIAKLLKKYGALRVKEIEEIAASKIQAFYLSYKCRKYGVSHENVSERDVLSNTDVLKRCQDIIDSCKASTFSKEEDNSTKLTYSAELACESKDNFSQLLHKKYFQNINSEIWLKSHLHASNDINLESQAVSEIGKDSSSYTDALNKCQPLDNKNLDTNCTILMNYQQSLKSFNSVQNPYPASKSVASIGRLEKNNDRFSLMLEDNSNLRNENKTYCTESKIDLESNAATVIQKAWRRYAYKTKFVRMRRNIKSKFNSVEERAKAENLWNLKLHTFYSQW